MRRFLAGAAYDTEVVRGTAALWVGNASWLRAELFGASDPYVPAPLLALEGVLANGTAVVNDILIDQVGWCFMQANTTPYSVAHADEVVAFLQANHGHLVFLVKREP